MTLVKSLHSGDLGVMLDSEYLNLQVPDANIHG
jgi:hypothetical protein